jgi:hypothetical protein
MQKIIEITPMLLSRFSIKFGLRSFIYFKNVLMNMTVSGLETKTAIFILSHRHLIENLSLPHLISSMHTSCV